MGPLFTSRGEWRELRPAGRRAYLRTAVGYTLRAGTLGLAALILLCEATEPYWRSAPVLAIFAASLLAGGSGAYALFRREWEAAERRYGTEEYPITPAC
jgi:hypothetical protein